MCPQGHRGNQLQQSISEAKLESKFLVKSENFRCGAAVHPSAEQ